MSVHRDQDGGADADHGKEANVEGSKVEGWAGEVGCQSCPEGCLNSVDQEGHKTAVGQNRLCEHHADDAPQNIHVFAGEGLGVVGVWSWIVGEEKPHEGNKDALEAESNPVDVTPGRILRDDASDDTRDCQAHHHAGQDEGDSRGSLCRWRECANEWE